MSFYEFLCSFMQFYEVFMSQAAAKIATAKPLFENLKLGAYTRNDKNINQDIEMIYNYLNRLKERTGLAGYFSGGEQQMLARGRALIARPKMICFDEPSMGLSPLLVKEVFDIIGKINRDQGISMLVVEQNSNYVIKAADYGYIMKSGKIVLDGTQGQLLNNEDVKQFYLGGGNEN
ncbi:MULTISPECIES: ABC transporter ATP-binding protein [unclassified Colwellia]|uniref:ABC transporter ATP-binding protein n=1 Tax=unclassified Colwellia TaxID=196834 RepID=UPI0021751714|nr:MULTISPECIES: ATP-binding cassette domain-containing protein [unclassified Colwellia]